MCKAKEDQQNMMNRTDCLSLIPSTRTWVFVDLFQIFDNVSFICEPESNITLQENNKGIKAGHW